MESSEFKSPHPKHIVSDATNVTAKRSCFVEHYVHVDTLVIVEVKFYDSSSPRIISVVEGWDETLVELSYDNYYMFNIMAGNTYMIDSEICVVGWHEVNVSAPAKNGNDFTDDDKTELMKSIIKIIVSRHPNGIAAGELEQKSLSAFDAVMGVI